MTTSLILSAGLVVIAWLWLRFAKREVSLPIWSTLEIPELAADASPFVSIVVAAGNRAHDLERCVQSLLRQDYSRFEVIVVDASSSDETRKRLLKIEATTGGELACPARCSHRPDGLAGQTRSAATGDGSGARGLVTIHHG